MDVQREVQKRLLEEAEVAQNEAANRAKALALAVDLRNLGEHRGWQAFELFLNEAEKMLVDQLATERNSEVLQRLSASLFTIRSVREWRPQSIRAADELLIPG